MSKKKKMGSLSPRKRTWSRTRFFAAFHFRDKSIDARVFLFSRFNASTRNNAKLIGEERARR